MFVAQALSRATTIRRYNNGQSRNFSYEAIVNNRNRNSNGNVSGVRYDWRGGWSGNDSGDGGYG